MVQIGKSTFAQRADEVQGGGRSFVTADQADWVRTTGLGFEGIAVDDVSSIARQSQAIDRFGIARAGFGVLACNPSDPDDLFAGGKDDHQAHLQEEFEFAGDLFGLALFEGLGAIPALEHPSFTALGGSQAIFEVIDFPTCDQRRELLEFFDGLLEFVWVWVVGLLSGRELLPGVRSPRWVHTIYRQKVGWLDLAGVGSRAGACLMKCKRINTEAGFAERLSTLRGSKNRSLREKNRYGIQPPY